MSLRHDVTVNKPAQTDSEVLLRQLRVKFESHFHLEMRSYSTNRP